MPTVEKMMAITGFPIFLKTWKVREMSGNFKIPGNSGKVREF